MNILICSSIYPGLGGIPRHCDELSKQLGSNKIDLNVLDNISDVIKKLSNTIRGEDIINKINKDNTKKITDEGNGGKDDD